MGLIAVVPTVVIPITGPVHWDAAPTVAFELVAGAGMAAASFIAVVPAVIVWKEEEGRRKGQGLPRSAGVGATLPTHPLEEDPSG